MAKEDENVERFASLIDINVITQLIVIIVGLGRVGMSFLKQIIQYPIKKVILVDHDSVSKKELGSVFPLTCSGSFKVEAASQFVKYWNSRIECKAVRLRVGTATIEQLDEYIEEANFLVWCADDWRALIDIVHVSYHRIPTVATALSEHASYAETSWSVRGTRCVACALQAATRTRAEGAHNLPSDLDTCVNVAVSCTIGLALLERKGFELFGNLLEPRHNLLITQTRNNSFTSSSNQLVSRLTRLVPVGSSCRVCRG